MLHLRFISDESKCHHDLRTTTTFQYGLVKCKLYNSQPGVASYMGFEDYLVQLRTILKTVYLICDGRNQVQLVLKSVQALAARVRYGYEGQPYSEQIDEVRQVRSVQSRPGTSNVTRRFSYQCINNKYSYRPNREIVQIIKMFKL